MLDPSLLPYLYLLTGLLLGAFGGWLVTRLRAGQSMMPKKEVDQRYVLRELHERLSHELDSLQRETAEKNHQLQQLQQQHAVLQSDLRHQRQQLQEQAESFGLLQKQARLEFESVANRLLEEKSRKFTDANQKQMEHILSPLREKIKEFGEDMEKKFRSENETRISLKEEIKYLRELNTQLSSDANNLALALKGDQKVQGDWGEIQLQRLLEHAGLQKDLHFRTQATFRGSDGQNHRPDFIIHLPDDKHLVIDAKVSLTAYNRYHTAESEDERQQYLREHLSSLRRHIRELSDKNYQDLYQINSPDYLLLFVPIEPAFVLATREDGNLFLEALDRNIVLVTTTTLLATMRTVSYLWKQEKQKRSVLEIARQSGLLYDKFVSFVEDLQEIGQRLEQTQTAFGNAMNKLKTSPKYGTTLIGRAERIRELGARARKRLPASLLDADLSAENGREEEE